MYGDVGVSRLAVTQLPHGLIGSNPITSTKFCEEGRSFQQMSELITPTNSKTGETGKRSSFVRAEQTARSSYRFESYSLEFKPNLVVGKYYNSNTWGIIRG